LVVEDLLVQRLVPATVVLVPLLDQLCDPLILSRDALRLQDQLVGASYIPFDLVSGTPHLDR
jgi:hypothetical protein